MSSPRDPSFGRGATDTPALRPYLSVAVVVNETGAPIVEGAS